jgi:hypothetical protein
MVPRALAFAALLVVLPASARAVTVDDLMALARAGVGAEVLVAVIDADRTVFTLTPAQIVALRQAGVPDAVLVKMLGSAKEFVDEVPEPLIVGSGPAPAPPAATLVVPVPAFVPYPVFLSVPVLPPLTFEMKHGFGRFINDGFVGRRPGRFMNP